MNLILKSSSQKFFLASLLSITTLSIGGNASEASPQIICVKLPVQTLCGNPIPNEKASPSSTNSNEEITNAIDNIYGIIIAWQLNYCTRDKKVSTTVVCTFHIVSYRDTEYVLKGTSNFILEKGGKYAHRVSAIQGFNRSIVGGEYNNPAYIVNKDSGETNKYNLQADLSKGTTYKVTVKLQNIPTSLAEIAFLQLSTYANGSYSDQVKFRNIKIK